MVTMTQVQDDVEVEESQMREADSVSDFETDKEYEFFYNMVLDYRAVLYAIREDVEDYMNKFLVEFRVGVEAERQKSLRDRIIRKRSCIHEYREIYKPCYITMEREEYTEDGDSKYIMPPGSSWKSMFEKLEHEYMIFTEDLSKLFRDLIEFLDNCGPNALGEEHVMCGSDKVHIRDSFKLLHHLVRLSEKRRRDYRG